MTCQLILGDCRDVMPKQGLPDVVIADPPYGDTSLEWDTRVEGWLGLVRLTLKPHGSLWVFGSMRFFMASAEHFRAAGWRYAQDVVWEKHNGSGFHADRFKRVHEHAVQFYPADVKWADIYKKPVTTPERRRAPCGGRSDRRTPAISRPVPIPPRTAARGLCARSSLSVHATATPSIQPRSRSASSRRSSNSRVRRAGW